MSETTEILNLLKSLKDSSANIPYDVFYRLFQKLNLTRILAIPVPLGTPIYRIRLAESKPFTNRSQISFNPICKSYGRANSPGNPMFYGSFGTEKMRNPLQTVFDELLHILRNDYHKYNTDGLEFTIGQWEVVKEMRIVPIVFTPICTKKHKLFKPLYNTNETNCYTDSELNILKFFSNEFAETNCSNNNSYKLTSAFTDYILKFNPHCYGIIYPSVRNNYEGFNIAIKPEIIDTIVQLKSVANTKRYINLPHSIVDWESVSTTILDNGDFELLPNKNKFGYNKCHEILESFKKGTAKILAKDGFIDTIVATK